MGYILTLGGETQPTARQDYHPSTHQEPPPAPTLRHPHTWHPVPPTPPVSLPCRSRLATGSARGSLWRLEIFPAGGGDTALHGGRGRGRGPPPWGTSLRKGLPRASALGRQALGAPMSGLRGRSGAGGSRSCPYPSPPHSPARSMVRWQRVAQLSSQEREPGAMVAGRRGSRRCQGRQPVCCVCWSSAMPMPLRLPPERPFSIMGSRLPPPPARPRRQRGGGKSKEASDVAKEQRWGWLCMRAPGVVRRLKMAPHTRSAREAGPGLLGSKGLPSSPSICQRPPPSRELAPLEGLAPKWARNKGPEGPRD